MRTGTDSRRTFPRSGRVLGGIALFAFLSAFFVVPLWAALTLCTMPCCNHDGGSGPNAVLAADMAGCQTECSVGAADAEPTTAPVIAPAHNSERGVLTTPAVAAVQITQPSAVAVSSIAEPAAHGPDAPIHVLNSTFRI